jgi:hypothetical protein
VDRARADNRQQAIVLTPQDGIGLAAGIGNQFGCLLGKWKIVRQNRRRNKRIQASDSEVVGAVSRHAGIVDGEMLAGKAQVAPPPFFAQKS